MEAGDRSYPRRSAIRQFQSSRQLTASGRFQPVRSSLRVFPAQPQVFQIFNARLQLVVNDARADAV
jgi:peptidoglycan hydrolase-like protein with peptidoglycan-binding domain